MNTIPLKIYGQGVSKHEFTLNLNIEKVYVFKNKIKGTVKNFYKKTFLMDFHNIFTAEVK